MRIAIASSFACGLSFWSRLSDEGSHVRVWLQDKEQAEVGRGLVEQATGWNDLLTWAKAGAITGEPTVMLFDSSGMGEQADEARKWGLHVIGGGKFCDKLEKDRSFGFEIARAAGAVLPDYKDFKSFDEAREFARSLPEESVYWKSDRFLESDATHKAVSGEELVEYLDSIIRRFGPRGECMIQETVEGIAVSTARWWNGKSFVGPYEGTIEHKKSWNDDVGPATGCAFNALWFYPDYETEIAQQLGFEMLAQAFLREQAPPGIYDMNSIAGADGVPYFLEWTPRFGYDSEPTSLCLWPNLSKFLWAIATGTELDEPSDDLAYTLRLTVPPYPWEHAKKDYKHGAYGVEVRGVDSLWEGDFLGYELAFDQERGLYVASPEGIVGCAYAQGTQLSELADEALETAKSLRASGLQYRTDGADAIREDARRLLSSGFEVPSSLLT